MTIPARVVPESAAGGSDASVPPYMPPSAAADYPFPGAAPGPAEGGDPSPDVSPAASAPSATGFPPTPGTFNPTRIDLGDVFGRTWEIFKREWGKCLVALLLVWLITAGFNVVVSIGFSVTGAISGDRFVAFVCRVMDIVVSALFGVWIGIGQTIYFLKIARGQRADLADIFSGAPHFWPILGASILFGLITFLGYILCIVPGVILALMFMQFYFLILDRRLGVMDSLSYSNQIMQGNKLTLFAIILVAILLGAAVVVCTCGVGLLAVLPFWGLLYPVVYLAITGQPTADRLAAGMTKP